MASVKPSHIAIGLFLLLTINLCVRESSQVDTEVEPIVSARCERNRMLISVITPKPFYGIIHTAGHKNDHRCHVYGLGSHNTSMSISTVASLKADDYCGVEDRNNNENKVATLVVRYHRELELTQDKFYSVSCSNQFASYQRIVNAEINLKFHTLTGHDTQGRLIQGSKYYLRIHKHNDDEGYSFALRHCVAFPPSRNETDVELIDENGCPLDNNLIEPLYYFNESFAQTSILSMPKFQGQQKLIIQCEVLLCRHQCKYNSKCERFDRNKFPHNEDHSPFTDASNLRVIKSSTVFVIEPDQEVKDFLASNISCEEHNFPWLVTLCIILGILLLIMLIVNLILCTSLSCACTKTEVVDKEEISDTEDYDPYKIDWSADNNNTKQHVSTVYGSRGNINNTHSLPKHFSDDEVSDYRSPSRYSTHNPSRNHSFKNDRNMYR